MHRAPLNYLKIHQIKKNISNSNQIFLMKIYINMTPILHYTT